MHKLMLKVEQPTASDVFVIHLIRDMRKYNEKISYLTYGEITVVLIISGIAPLDLIITERAKIFSASENKIQIKQETRQECINKWKNKQESNMKPKKNKCI